jgi:hypothetical protein
VCGHERIGQQTRLDVVSYRAGRWQPGCQGSIGPQNQTVDFVQAQIDSRPVDKVGHIVQRLAHPIHIPFVPLDMQCRHVGTIRIPIKLESAMMLLHPHGTVQALHGGSL